MPYTKKKTITILSILIYILPSPILIAENILNCGARYKICKLEIIDSHTDHANLYDKESLKCLDTLDEIRNLEYAFTRCINEFRNCKGETVDLEKLINETPDIRIATADAFENTLSEKDIEEISEAAKRLPFLRSLLVSDNQKLLFEDYYSYKEEFKPHAIYSITKSIVSLLIGIAIDQGYIPSEDMLIKSYFPEYFKLAHDKRKDLITIKHILTMSSGINFSDRNNWNNDANEVLNWWREDNAYDWILYRDMLLSYQPGDNWLYNTPSIDLLTSILRTATGKSTLEFAEANLFKPLGINNYLWIHDSKENYIGGYTLYLRPRALARIGKLILNNGTYKGKQIVSKSWIDKSLSNQFALGGEEAWEYGYLWWRFRVDGIQVTTASGWGGQLITLVPALNLVIVTTSDAHVCSADQGHDQINKVLDLAKQIILIVRNNQSD